MKPYLPIALLMLAQPSLASEYDDVLKPKEANLLKVSISTSSSKNNTTCYLQKVGKHFKLLGSCSITVNCSGSSGDSVKWTVQNQGGITMELRDVFQVGGTSHASISSNNCSYTNLQPNQSCQIGVYISSGCTRGESATYTLYAHAGSRNTTSLGAILFF